jgi:two-component system, OmpR family, response regulator
MRVLMIEDDKSLVASLRVAVEDAGFVCDVAYDGADGLQQAIRGQYDLIVLDIMLPTLNGFKVCSELRKLGNRVPIVMLTAKVGEWDEAEGLDTGADDYLTKPVSLVVFMAHLRALLRRTYLASSTEIVVDGVSLNPVRRLCRFGGQEVQLSGREVEVLAGLMAADGAVIAKQDLLRQVWGDQFKGDDNIVEVYVRHLRTKLRSFGRLVVATVPGEGYRFCVSEGL